MLLIPEEARVSSSLICLQLLNIQFDLSDLSTCRNAGQTLLEKDVTELPRGRHAYFLERHQRGQIGVILWRYEATTGNKQYPEPSQMG